MNREKQLETENLAESTIISRRNAGCALKGTLLVAAPPWRLSAKTSI